MATEVEHLHVSYNDIHNLICAATPKIAAEFAPDLLVAIGGGGFFPARVLRTFLREQTENKSLQIQAIGLSLYEPVPGVSVGQIGQEVIRTQWLSPSSVKLLAGRRTLIVDEVDDTRKTLHYALSELQKDVNQELLTYPESQRDALRAATQFGIFVVHNKDKPKLAELPAGTPYFSGQEVEDVWLEYPWEQSDIEKHDILAKADREKYTAKSKST